MCAANPTDTHGVEICVATDLSPSADLAVEHACKLAKAHGAEVRLLHVVHDPELAPALSNDVPGDVARAKQALAAIADGQAATCHIDVRTAEDIATAIVEAAKEASYLVVSSQGKSAFERLRIGSVATKVLRTASVPVVCCPHVDAAGG